MVTVFFLVETRKPDYKVQKNQGVTTIPIKITGFHNRTLLVPLSFVANKATAVSDPIDASIIKPNPTPKSHLFVNKIQNIPHQDNQNYLDGYRFFYVRQPKTYSNEIH